ncbi:hypothetical protein [Microbispora sp. KK1-11]|uniref:hypothetical protein n=1 Tax=Microbispora sp. KK1-11 TaxID=2053005 RepID=UPI00163D0267|nr:hypothetical protein [Microbispora sp. KK1-11]
MLPAPIEHAAATAVVGQGKKLLHVALALATAAGLSVLPATAADASGYGSTGAQVGSCR